jgi:hypothetical protein
VMVILRRALQRDPARRYASAGEMGQACEHFLYDKGYGPTNLTLKQHLYELFPGSAPAPTPAGGFPAIEPTLIPITDGGRTKTRVHQGDKTPVAPPRVYVTTGGRPAPDLPALDVTPPPGTLPPTTTRTSRRSKSRERPR